MKLLECKASRCVMSRLVQRLSMRVVRPSPGAQEKRKKGVAHARYKGALVRGSIADEASGSGGGAKQAIQVLQHWSPYELATREAAALPPSVVPRRVLSRISAMAERLGPETGVAIGRSVAWWAHDSSRSLAGPTASRPTEQPRPGWRHPGADPCNGSQCTAGCPFSTRLRLR